MSIRIKLLCVLLLVGASAIAVTGVLGYEAGKSGLTQTAMNQLTGIRRSKAYQIEAYFRTIRSQIRTLRQNPVTIEALLKFRDEFQRLDGPSPSARLRGSIEQYYRTEYLPRLHKLVPARADFQDYLPLGRGAYVLQDSFIVHNPYPAGEKKRLDAAPGVPHYSQVHAATHPLFRSFIEEFRYYDLFLVDARTGRIVYSVQKEVDFATSLPLGPYRKTGLAKAVEQARHAKDPDEVVLADFEMYEPSYGAPAAFAAAVVRDSDGPVGILAIQLATDEIDRVVSGDRGWERDGLGKSGDSGIVGSDYLLRSNARGFIQRREEAIEQMRARNVPESVIRRIRAYGSTVLQQRVRLPSVEAAIRGEEGTRVQIGSAGRESLVSYMPLSIPGLRWTIASRIDLAEALAPVERFRSRLLWCGFIVLIATAGIALILTRAICQPVMRLVGASQKVAACDFGVQVSAGGNDELGLLSRSFNQMVANIREKTEIIEQRNRENERLLLNILPEAIAVRLKMGETTIADSFSEVTVLFADLVGFTALSSKTEPQEPVTLLNELVSRFDEAAQHAGVEKIKTIGDAYMAVAGLPTAYPDHARRIVILALDMLRHVRDFRREKGVTLSIRIGINSGPVVAGIIGSTKFIYDLWGDTVNVASRMESHGVSDRIQVTRAVVERLGDEFCFEERGTIEVKGKGMMETWLLSLPAAATRHA
jgi:class 3 adenylate cyclase